MKRSTCYLACLLLAVQSSFSQQAQSVAPTPTQSSPATTPLPNTLVNGTAVKLRLSENLTSATAKVGDQVPFEVLEEVDVDGLPVIAKGAQALATVTTAEPKKRELYI